MEPTARRLHSGYQLVAEVRQHVLDVRCAGYRSRKMLNQGRTPLQGEALT